MNTNIHQMATNVLHHLEEAWNAADGAAYSAVFTEDADFVTIRGEYHQSRQAIAAGHQQIFDTIYQGSQVRYELVDTCPLAETVILAHIKSTLDAPTGPIMGRHQALATAVLVRTADRWGIVAFHNTLQV